MYSQSILPQEISSFEYYKEKLPLYLQNSYGFMEHFRIWYDLLTSPIEGDEGITQFLDSNMNEFVTADNLLFYVQSGEESIPGGITGIVDMLLYLINIFDKDYLAFTRDLKNSASTGETDYGEFSDMLDKIGAVFGVSRIFSCTYDDEGTATTEELSLNNEDFLLLIKCQIIKNYCEGSYSQIKEYYNNAGLKTFVITDDAPANSTIYLAEVPGEEYSDDVKKMFLAGMLNIESMGITYTNLLIVLDQFLKWDVATSTQYWDVGKWSV